MLAPMSWIKRFVDIDVDANEYCDDMIMTGSEVEGYTQQGENINKVVVGKIERISQHENADRLKVCFLDVGDSELLQVVTGADNVFEGAYVPVALVGCNLPTGLKIKKGKLRGVESFGMLCSGGELLIDDGVYEGAEYDGIMILKETYTPGMPITEAIGYNDVIIDFKTYANRPDTLSVMGLARETAATYEVPFKEPDYSYNEDEGKVTCDLVEVKIQDKDLCPRYMGKIVYDIKIEPSPRWMQKLLSAAGVRPINNIVDITNYVMLETGQPMHAFDFKYVKDSKIIVRRAKDGEELTTLDGKEYKLTEKNLVIADAQKAVALAGIMGGENSCVYDDTNVILFESANFNSFNIRRTSRQIGLRTESSGRFEKGIDPAACERAINRAMHLVEKLGVGKIAKGSCDVNYADVDERTITVDCDKINRLLGQNIPAELMQSILKRIFVESKIVDNKIECIIPTYRSDLENSADIAEEVMRLYGYDKIPSTLYSSNVLGGRTEKQKTILDIRNLMTSMGLYQSITYSFMSPSDLDKLLLEADDEKRRTVRISNPLGEDYSLMRTTLVPSMLQSIATNKNHNINEVKLFEIDSVFIPEGTDTKELPNEIKTLCIALNANDEDFFTLKGRLEVLFEKLNVKKIEFVNKDISYLHPGRRAEILCNGVCLGYIGELHPDVAETYDISDRTLISEINVDMLIQNSSDKVNIKPIPKYPAMSRDLAVIIDLEQNAGPIMSTIRQMGGNLLESVEIFDIYQGEQIEKGKKSVAFSLVFRAQDRTLVDKEVNNKFNGIVKRLEKVYNAKLRM